MSINRCLNRGKGFNIKALPGPRSDSGIFGTLYRRPDSSRWPISFEGKVSQSPLVGFQALEIDDNSVEIGWRYFAIHAAALGIELGLMGY